VFVKKSAYFALLILTLSACGAQVKSPISSTMGSAPVIAHTDQERALADQAHALDRLSRDMARKSTTTGAAIGAVAGCGLAIVSSSAKAQCLKGAVAGGVIGGVAGYAHGQSQVQKQVELISANTLLPSVRQTKDQLEVVKGGVASVIARQDAELMQMKSQLALGQISQAQYDERISAIKASRAELARALTQSAVNAGQANAAVKDAVRRGQTGLGWYLMETKKIQDESLSARAQISLL
jgi:hypothetical protein